MDLENLIKNKEAKVAIIGMGYVGLPHAVEIAKVGFDVSGPFHYYNLETVSSVIAHPL